MRDARRRQNSARCRRSAAAPKGGPFESKAEWGAWPARPRVPARRRHRSRFETGGQPNSLQMKRNSINQPARRLAAIHGTARHGASPWGTSEAEGGCCAHSLITLPPSPPLASPIPLRRADTPHLFAFYTRLSAAGGPRLIGTLPA